MICPILLFDPRLVFSAPYPVNPSLVIEIPLDSLTNTGLKGLLRHPAEFSCQFGKVNGIPAVMARAVFDKFYQLSTWVISFWHRKLIQDITNHLNNPDILHFSVATDVVSLASFSIFHYGPYGRAVVPHIEPVAHIETIPINRKGLSLKGIQDHEGKQFFRELVGAVIVGTVGDGHGEIIGLMVGPDEMVGSGL